MSLEETTEDSKAEAASTDGDATDTEAARPMNRAEKRALEHNKKAAAGGGMLRGGSGGSGMGKGVVSRAGNVRLPRTGHK